MIYLDAAATTPIDPEVIDVMVDYLRNEYGNPSSKYYPQAIRAQEALKHARNQVASLLNVEPEYVIFTSGATESNNMIIKGVAEKYSSKGKHIITSNIEHKSVLETCKYLEKKGFEVTYLNVDSNGLVIPSDLELAMRPDTILVSIMWGNNEIGTINDLISISDICLKNNVLLHSDATQVLGKMHVDLKRVKIDFLSMSAHKLYGPKGIGAAYIGPDDLGIRIKLPPLLHGGSQEQKLRAGTHAMHDIVGFGKACEVALRDMDTYIPQILSAEKELKDALIEVHPDITFNGDQTNKIPGLLSINIPGINNELLCKQIANILSISTGSACSLTSKESVIKTFHHEDNFIRITLSKVNLDSTLEIVNSLSSYFTY